MSINHDETSLMQKHQQGKKKKGNLQVNVNKVITETERRWRIQWLAHWTGKFKASASLIKWNQLVLDYIITLFYSKN